MKSPSDIRVYPADRASRATFILAHGAGAGQRSPFIVTFAGALAALGVNVVTFDFLYMEQGRRLPDRAPQLEASYRAVIEDVLQKRGTAPFSLFIGGKSMGGRIATQVAAADASLPIAGLALLGYPLHPPGQPERLRDAHLSAVKRPMLFVQGSRDAFGTPAELGPILSGLTPQPTLHVVDRGDHSFKRGGRDAKAQATTFDEIQRTMVNWMAAIAG